MATATEIANRALVLLGVDRIVSMDDDIKAARECKAQYDLTRKAELRAHRWGFAMKRASLAASSTAPLSQFALAYPFPTDLLRLDQVGEDFVGASLTDFRGSSEAAWAVQGRTIESNLAAPLLIRYVYDVTDMSQADALFVDALAARLAMDVCETLTQSDAKHGRAERKYAFAVQQAVAVNAIERPPEPLPDDSWLASRF